ncbi:hypothetical protein PAXRUDRAFT_147420 [Paxillus rubicundulus Ve08.2h10]|uniref:Aminotransferase class I/classII large domain-containing protein n=1 Tax=Paxillus rubicundulus Ve08.2h10 TaxID=930991 RepID=A0A0D0D6H0_9AGAM|nr:hypothetical protein PAXRUDRAFT_147420 [Paxillus rubicundulus Ve08.2h10]
MSQDTPLHGALRQKLLIRTLGGERIICFDELLPSSAGDFFSNDYLSLSTDAVLREHFLNQALAAPRLFGATASRLSTGNSAEINVLEGRLQRFFGYPAAVLFPSGYSANASFFSTVPQEGDAIIYDERTHVSCRDGFRSSPARGATYRFAHNSVASLEECIQKVLRKHPGIAQGNSTAFVSVESLYSMEGTFCPLVEMVEVIEKLIPAGHAHIVVDEAHTSALCGPNGSGYISLLGLHDRIHTVVHTFGKGWGFHGAAILTSRQIREYMLHITPHLVFSTAVPYTDIYGLSSCLDIISGERGEQLRQRLRVLCRHAHKQLLIALKRFPEGLLFVEKFSMDDTATRDLDICSPIFPLCTAQAKGLSDYLLTKGYASSPIIYPIVKSPRVRMSIHVSNTEADIDSFVGAVVEWATNHAQDVVPLVVHPENKHGEMRARL